MKKTAFAGFPLERICYGFADALQYNQVAMKHRLSETQTLIFQFLKYSMCGCVAMAVDMITFFLVAWLLSPALARWASRPPPAGGRTPLAAADAGAIAKLARVADVVCGDDACGGAVFSNRTPTAFDSLPLLSGRGAARLRNHIRTWGVARCRKTGRTSW